MSSNGTADSSADVRFVDAAHGVLQAVTGSAGEQARQMAHDMLAIDRLEHSTATQVARSARMLEQLRADSDDAKRALDSRSAAVAECAAGAARARESIDSATELARAALAAIDELDAEQLEVHGQRVREMEQRNRAFEQRLRREHDEFTRMHARRLAKALEG
ncbi:hypothetical protein H4R21_003856, partial [Coemansia helicoidea]